MSSQEACSGSVGDGDPGVRGDPGAGGLGRIDGPLSMNVDVQPRVGALVELVQEAGEGNLVVVLDRLGDHLAGGGVQRGDDGGGAVADVLELPPGPAPPPPPARPRRPLGNLRDLASIPVFSSMQIITVPGGGRR